MNRCLMPLLALLVVVLIQVQAVEPPDARKQVISAGEASRDAKLATSRIRLPSGLKADLFAAEPLLANPVAFCFDPKGNIYVAETYRIHAGVTDNRSHMYWLDDELALTTVADRDAKYKKYLKENYKTYEKERDQVRMLVDSKGQGKPDTSYVFSDNYRKAVDGLGSGVLVHQGSVYFTCIPDLWKLRDTKNAHHADVQQSLSTGYGVHTSFIGHDLHGLAVSPVDGKIYFSIGDRGANIVTKEGKKIEVPHCGAVFRCNADGSELELFAKGLRNPQELAFDDDGNLFTGDNNSDSGDKARFVYLPYGADCGWHIGWQYLEKPYSRGPWNSEFMWHPSRSDQPAFIVPPLINIGDGPSGLAYYPGTGLPEKYQGHFFMCDFRGTPTNSGIRSFAVKPKGAGFEVVDSQQFAWSVLATDVDFGPDGGLYILDWVEGWGKTGKGRIHRIADPNYLASEQSKSIKQLLASDWSKKTVKELASLLGHVDRRVRMEAQATLVRHPEKQTASYACLESLRNCETETGKVFHIWTLGQLLRHHPTTHAVKSLKLHLFNDSPRLTLAVLKILSENKPAFTLTSDELNKLLHHENPQVKAQAALCLAVQPQVGCLPTLLELLDANKDDAWMRHACTMALTSLLQKDPATWEVIQTSTARPSARLAGVVAARKLLAEKALIAFLNDTDVAVQQEAIRAIHDEPGLVEAKRALAALPISKHLTVPVQLRLLNAQLIAGDAAAAQRLSEFISDISRNETLRIEAIKMLGAWAKPSGRDWAIGLWRPIAPRSAEPAQAVVAKAFGSWKAAKSSVLSEVLRTVEKLKINSLADDVVAVAQNDQLSVEARLTALQAANALSAGGVEKLAEVWMSSKEAKLRQAAQTTLVKLHPEKAVSILDRMYSQGGLREQQVAIAQLAKLGTESADVVLQRLLNEFAEGKLAPAVQLELQEAVQQRKKAEWKPLWDKGVALLGKQGPYAEHRPALSGGDASEGRKVFFEKIAAACLRCHKVGKEGGEVGPELTLIGKEKTREYLLESIVDTSKTIAKGFELSIILTTDGVVHQGVVKKEDANTVTIITPEAKTVTLKKADIEDRKTGKSAMPEDTIKHLSPRELRDLLEYLVSLK